MNRKKIGRATLHLGDCIDVMRALPDCSIDSIVTDPPYELGFMGKKWDSTGISNSVDMWREALRVLKPGGHLLSFSGSRTYHRMACAIEDAGFDIRDQIMWVYSSGFPKSTNVSKAIDKAISSGKPARQWDGWGTALKPAHEPIAVARKPFKGTVAANVLEHGTGALNIDGCRINWPGGAAPEVGTPGWGGPAKKLTVAPGQQGKTVDRSAPSDFGRFPANLIHDGSEDVIALFPQSGGQQGDVTGAEESQPAANCYGEYNRVPFSARKDSGSAARFFYCAKTSRADRHDGLVNPGPQFQQGTTLRDVESQNTSGNNHPTVKPTDLMAYLCRLVTPPDGIVLDPFMGSGSTGKAAVREGFNFMGIEMMPEYFDIACQRIEYEQRQGRLFD